MNQLHPRVQLVWFFRTGILAMLLGGGLFVGHIVIDLPLWLAPATAGAVVVVGIPFIRLRFRKWGYEMRDDALYLERGVFTEVRTVIPYVRIQHVDSRRNPGERAIGLASTVVYTAGSRGSDVRIPGLTDAGARDLREDLKRLAILAGEEDAV